jgi:hypothetical protein
MRLLTADAAIDLLLFMLIFYVLHSAVVLELPRTSVVMGAGILGGVSSLGLVTRRLRQINSFYEARTRALREIYAHNDSPERLFFADRVFQDGLERYGAVDGRRFANDQLREILPESFGRYR